MNERGRFRDRLKHAWNTFRNKDYPEIYKYENLGSGYSIRPDRIRLGRGNEKSIVTSVYNRIGIDVSSMSIQHVRLDQNGRYLETLD